MFSKNKGLTVIIHAGVDIHNLGFTFYSLLMKNWTPIEHMVP